MRCRGKVGVKGGGRDMRDRTKPTLHTAHTLTSSSVL